MEKVPKIVADRLRVTTAVVGHPDANVLTAFAEKCLPIAEREDVLKHLSRCEECREIVALALPAVEETQSAVVIAHQRWPVLRWGLALAGVVVIASFGAVLYQRHGAGSMVAYKASQAVTEARNEAPASQPAEEKAKTELPHALHAADSSSTAEHPSKVTGTLPQAGEPTAGGAADVRRDIAAPRPLPHGPRMTNQLNQWQQNANGTAVAGSAPSAPPPPVAKQAQGQLIANQRAASEAVQLESAPALDAQSQNQEALLVQTMPLPQQPARSGIADARVDKAKPADTVVNIVPPKVIAPYQASENMASAGIPVWSIDSAGRLERSYDQGNTFQQVDVKASPVAASFSALAKSEVAGKKDAARTQPQANAPNAPIVFRAVASNGLEVWAGGSAGQLYHSMDAGSHWNRVVLSSAGVALTGDIVGIDFSDAQHGTISTSTPETWTTSDDGVTWLKQ